MGADAYEPAGCPRRDTPPDRPPIGIGKSTRIEGAIVDKNARIGHGCVVRSAGKAETLDHPLYYVRDGVMVVPNGAVLMDGTLI